MSSYDKFDKRYTWEKGKVLSNYELIQQLRFSCAKWRKKSSSHQQPINAER